MAEPTEPPAPAVTPALQHEELAATFTNDSAMMIAFDTRDEAPVNSLQNFRISESLQQTSMFRRWAFQISAPLGSMELEFIIMHSVYCSCHW